MCKLALYDAERQVQTAALSAVQNANLIMANFSKLARLLTTNNWDLDEEGLVLNTRAIESGPELGLNFIPVSLFHFSFRW